jgi:hypothetical protein
MCFSSSYPPGELLEGENGEDAPQSSAARAWWWKLAVDLFPDPKKPAAAMEERQ